MWDKIVMGLTVAAIGIVVVFAILLILIFIIQLISKIIGSTQKAVTNKQEEESVVYEDVQANEKDNNAIIVAITAAIYAVLSSENAQGVSAEFEIKKIRQIKR